MSTTGSHAIVAASDSQPLRPDDEHAMSPADWLADIEVAVTESLLRTFLQSDEPIASMPAHLASVGGRG